jgi:hypothetical protein
MAERDSVSHLGSHAELKGDEPTNQHPVVPRLRYLAPWLAIFGLMAGAIASLGLVLRVFYESPNLFSQLLEKEVRAVVGIPN